MNQEKYDAICQLLHQERIGIQDSKRPGYTVGNRDVLHNFKSVAERVGISTGQVWAVYALKHVDAIMSIMCHPDLPVSEAPIGRFSDLMNYCELGFGIYVESQGGLAQSPSPEGRNSSRETSQDHPELSRLRW